jgi:hypothetical protein
MIATWYRGGASSFSPLSIFAGSGAGMWLDPSDISTGYQDSGGLTAQSAAGQPTGLRFDKRLGSVYGSELVTNGDFASTTTGWTANESTLSVVSGQLQLMTAGVGGFNTSCSQTIATVSGTTYTIRGRLYKGTCANSVSINIGASTAGSNATTTPTDISFTYTAVGASTVIRLAVGGNESGTTAFFDNISVKAWNGNHVLQATGVARPLYDVIGGISSDYLDGSDDGYATTTLAAGTLTADMDIFVAVNPAVTSNAILFSEDTADATRYFGLSQSGTAGSGTAAAGVGSAWTCYVNGVQVGGTATTSGAQLNSALGSGAYKVLEFRNLDLSAWTKLTLGLYTANLFNGDNAQLVLCPAQSTANRNSLRTYVGAKAGLTL